MIQFELTCATCGRERLFVPRQEQFSSNTTIGEVVNKVGWIGQQNGENFDTYCSKRCAE